MSDFDDDERTCTGIVINNTVNLANFAAFKDAKLDDGLADILILRAGWIRQTLHNFSLLSTLGIYDSGERSQNKNVRISLASPQTLMLDGQLLANVTSVCIESVPAALWCRKLTPS